MNYISEIQKHFEKEYPREGCGVLGIVKGKYKWFPCTNRAHGADDFIIDSSEYISILRKADIVAIVHSHPDASPEPSQYDIDSCNALGIPYYIFSYPEMELHKLEPIKRVNPLIGREYKFGVTDCFEAMRDWYLSNTDIKLQPRWPFEDNWWERGLDYFSDEILTEWGFEKVDSPGKGDLLIFAVEDTVRNHCGVYLGNDVFFHHAVNRLSCRENLFPLWARYLVGTYRYVA